MPKILRIINRFNIGGPTYNVAYLTKYLSSNYETCLLGGDREEGEASSKHILDELGLKPIILPQLQRSVSLFSDLNAFLAIRRIIKEFKPDIVHTHASKAGALGRLAAISCKVPCIVHTFHGHVFHSYFGAFKTYVFKQIERLLAKKTDVIIAISELQMHELANVYKIAPPHKFKVVPLGFDLRKFREGQDEKRIAFRKRYGLKTDDIAIGILGRLVEIKHHTFFIDLVARAQNDKVKFFIVGDGHLMQHLQEYASNKGINWIHMPEAKDTAARQLTFTSWMTQTDIFFAGIDIVALTSKNEGTPVSLIEAQASGKPVITTNVGGVENILPNAYPYCYAVDDFEGFWKGLNELITQVKSNQAKSLINSQAILNKYSYQRLVADMEQVYVQCLSKNSK